MTGRVSLLIEVIELTTTYYGLYLKCTALEILAAFNANLKHYRDQILEELQNEKEIQIK